MFETSAKGRASGQRKQEVLSWYDGSVGAWCRGLLMLDTCMHAGLTVRCCLSELIPSSSSRGLERCASNVRTGGPSWGSNDLAWWK